SATASALPPPVPPTSHRLTPLNVTPLPLRTPLPMRTPPPVTAAEQPRVVANFEVSVISPPPAMKLIAADVSRGGLFLCTASSLPPLFSKVQLGLPRPGGPGM